MYYGQAQDHPQGLDKESYLIVAKLTAILRLANSLDRSHKQKMKGVKATLQDNELILKIDTQEDIIGTSSTKIVTKLPDGVTEEGYVRYYDNHSSIQCKFNHLF